MSYFVYFDSSGCCTGVVNSDLDRGAPDSGYLFKSSTPVDPNLVYSDGVYILQKSNMTLEVSSNVISGIPEGSTAYIGMDTYTVAGGSIELEVDFPSTVLVILEHVMYLTKEILVQCE